MWRKERGKQLATADGVDRSTSETAQKCGRLRLVLGRTKSVTEVKNRKAGNSGKGTPDTPCQVACSTYSIIERVYKSIMFKPQRNTCIEN